MSGRRCLQICCIWFMMKNYVSQYTKKAYTSINQKGLKKKREKTLFLLQYPNAPDVGWRQSGKDSACSRIKAFHPLAFTNSLKTSMKVQLERVSHCIGSPTIIRHWKIAPMTTTLSCEAASWSSIKKQMCASGDRPVFKRMIVNACPSQCLIQSPFPAWQGRIKWKFAKYTNIKPLNS